MDKAKMSRGWRRLLVLFCTLLLAASMFIVLGMTVWAQDQPADTTEEPTAEQPTADTTQTQGDGLVIDYWEPEIGTRTVYYVNDYRNDVYGQFAETKTLGYDDAASLYYYENPRPPVNWSSSYYKNVAAISDMNPVYFDLEGPWYFNMTTPFKVVEEVIGIDAAPDAMSFPEATYAVQIIVIGSGGHRYVFYEYRSNDSALQEWLTWGYTKEYIPDGALNPIKEIEVFHSPSDPELRVATIRSFPMQVGDTGTISAIKESGGNLYREPGVGTRKVIAEGQVSTPGGTYDALLIKKDLSYSEGGRSASHIVYEWFVQDIGVVVYTRSLPDILGPTYGETTGYIGKGTGVFYVDEGMQVLESFTAGTPSAQ